MIALNDPRWSGLKGGYRVPYDPRKALVALAKGRADDAWRELWNGLHHQGDVGEASYMAVPELVRIHGERGIPDWNTYALVATIEDARQNQKNPRLPPWLQASYDEALRNLANLGLDELRKADADELVCSIIAIVAMAKRQPLLGRFAIAYTDDERQEILERADYV